LKTVGIIGSGFSGLAAACTLAKEGFKVSVFEKNEGLGGRARKFERWGLCSIWALRGTGCPRYFENFFNRFGKSASDYYELIRLDPSYNVIFGKMISFLCRPITMNSKPFSNPSNPEAVSA
jgi:phytoene desaturase